MYAYNRHKLWTRVQNKLLFFFNIKCQAARLLTENCIKKIAFFLCLATPIQNGGQAYRWGVQMQKCASLFIYVTYWYSVLSFHKGLYHLVLVREDFGNRIKF